MRRGVQVWGFISGTMSTEERITLKHGAGGTAMVELIEEVFAAAYGDANAPRDDSARLDLTGPLAFTTDSFVVDPIFFPGGDIGRLAVAGTVNDLLAVGARPVALSASFIIEEGLPVRDLVTVAQSMAKTAAEAEVRIVTGDTKVVARGSADKVFITTSGVGCVLRDGISGAAAKPGDAIILTGSIGDHGAAVMLAREKLLDTDAISSDTAPLNDIVLSLINAECEIHTMRDPTRGGIGAALNEIAKQSAVGIELEERAIIVKPPVAAACEALGIDPLYVANEGKMLVIVSAADAQRSLDIIRQQRWGAEASIIGRVTSNHPGQVRIRTSIGTTRVVSPPSGELLPRIC
ncbi:MAG: hydrogenase expression/formation protein HypE [Armatimonadota bacterium]|nr:hydrogenase expression/formation protein HypE [Armatimonadota bacterium]